jgi:peptidyl-tRNA hydrolase
MVFVVNTSLKMGAGKMAAQVGHAAVALYRLCQQNEEVNLIFWLALRCFYRVKRHLSNGAKMER